MIYNNSLNKLYDAIIEKTELSTNELYNCGFNFNDINQLIQCGVIKRVDNDLYTLNFVDDLYRYGKQLIIQKKYDEASLCFTKCLELDPTNRGACFQLFLKNILNKDYENAFIFYDKLLELDNNFYHDDANYYLYLLSVVTEVPDKYKEYVKILKLEDIMVNSSNTRYLDVSVENNIRRMAFNRKFSLALNLLESSVHGIITSQDLVVKRLLYSSLKSENKSRLTTVYFIKNKKYEDAFKHLKEKGDRHNLSILDTCILKLLKELIEIKKNSLVPQRIKTEENDIFIAIDNHDYLRALKLSKLYDDKYHYSHSKSPITILLNDILSLVVSLSLKEHNVYVNEKNLEDDDLFPMVISYVVDNQMDKAIHSLNLYMELFGKSKYSFLVIDLIKISILEGDLTFSKPIELLSMLKNENVTVDYSKYVDNFNVALSKNKTLEALIYLDIVSKGNELGENSIEINTLHHTLDISQKELSKEEDFSFESSDKTSKVIISNSEKEFVSEKHRELLQNKGIILLEAMSDEKIFNILQIVKDYPDIVASVIKDENSKRIFLRYKPYLKETININKVYNEGNKAYNEKMYQKCIDNYLQLLEIFDEPKASIYAKLGLSYMKINNKKLAIDYLTIATALSKDEKIDIDFSSLIVSLKGEFSSGEFKSSIKMRKSDFSYDSANEVYRVENFDEINSYIVNSGLDVESACKNINMTSEQIDIIKLVYAKEYYSQGHIEKGDLFLKSFERSKNKTKESIKMYREIMKNKKFYQNRQVHEPRKLSLSLKPRK